MNCMKRKYDKDEKKFTARKVRKKKTESILKVIHSSISPDDFLLTFTSMLDPSKSSSSCDVFGFLLNDDKEAFFEDCWEQRPCHFTRNLGEDAILDDILSRKSFQSMVRENKLAYADNFNVLRYDGLDRELWNTQDTKRPKVKDIKDMFSNGFTIQFFQPQRFSDGLYCINSSFEKYFQVLAGASAYLTPKLSQGLAPHYDDVEVFVLQTEGTKKWHLWESDMLLAETHSNSIPRENLPQEMIELIMHPGDLLYLPRGTIHEAIALDSFSTHITISVFQKHNMKTLISSAFSKVLETAFHESIEIRRGLPISLNKTFGSYISKVAYPDEEVGNLFDTCNSSSRDSMESTRQAFTQHLQNLVMSIIPMITSHVLDECADEIIGDFIMHRLPSTSNPPTQDVPCEIKEILLMEYETTVGEKDENMLSSFTSSEEIHMLPLSDLFIMVQGESPHKRIALAHNRNNNRLAHMDHPPCEEQGECHSEDDEEDEVTEGTESDDDTGPWELFLPLRYGPILREIVEATRCTESLSPKKTYQRLSITAMMDKLSTDKKIYSLPEMIDCCSRLKLAGFIA